MVGVCHSIIRESGVQSDEQVQRLGLAHLTDDDPRRSHPQGLLDQAAQRYLTCALETGLTALHAGHITERDLQLEDLLTRDHALPCRDGRGETVEEGGLACLGAAGDQDVQPGHDAGLEELGRLTGDRPEPDQVVEVVRLDDELAYTPPNHHYD